MPKKLSDNPIKIESYEQLWKLRNKDIIECVCPNCGKVYQSRVATKRRKQLKDFLICCECSRKQCLLEKYGVDNFFKSEKVKNIVKSRDKKWYQEQAEKSKKTNLKRYGVEHPQQLKEVREKQKQTMRENYGIDNIFYDKEYIKKCCNKKLGRDNYFSGEEGKRLAEEACLRKHGVRKALKKEEFKQKYKETNLERYGTDNYAKTEEHTIKMQNTNLEKFGTIHAPSYNYEFDNTSFDSSWELSFWIYCKDNNIPIEREPVSLPYTYKDKNCYYIPDFKINNSTLIEIKGNYFLDENKNLKNIFEGQEPEKIKAKNGCMKNNNVRIITSPEINKYLNYVKETYGKDYLSQFKK